MECAKLLYQLQKDILFIKNTFIEVYALVFQQEGKQTAQIKINIKLNW